MNFWNIAEGGIGGYSLTKKSYCNCFFNWGYTNVGASPAVHNIFFFPKIGRGWRVQGHLEFFQKFIHFGIVRPPSVWSPINSIAPQAFIDEEILLILGQMDPASRIFDFLFLGR